MTPPKPPEADPLDRWDRAVSIPLLVLGVIFIVSFSVYVIGVELLPIVRLIAGAAAILTWFAFAADYIVRIVVTPRGARWEYLWRHPLELLAVLLPVFRAVRVVDLIRQAPYFHHKTGAVVRTEIIAYAVAYSVVFVYFISLSTLQVERDAPEATITSFGEAVWWACVTLATVGYGDVYPVTVLGRFFAVLLMMGGIAIIGVTSGTVVSYITDRIRATTAPRPPSADSTTEGA